MSNKVPTFDKLINPCFQAIINLGGSASVNEIYDEVVASLNLSEEVLSIIQPGHGTMSRVAYNLAWARTYLKKYGAVDNTSRGIWSLSTEFSNQKQVDSQVIVETVRKLKYQARNSEQNLIETKKKDVVDDISEETDSWRVKMLEILQNMNPYGFERFIQFLFRNCGIDNVEVTKKSGDGGIDGIGQYKLGGIFSFKLAFQCKRYSGTVGSAEIRDFRGSLSTDVEKAVFVTTGVFSSSAKTEAIAPGKKPIDLIDGEGIIDKIAELQIGVEPRTTYEINDKFFAQYNES